MPPRGHPVQAPQGFTYFPLFCVPFAGNHEFHGGWRDRENLAAVFPCRHLEHPAKLAQMRQTAGAATEAHGVALEHDMCRGNDVEHLLKLSADVQEPVQVSQLTGVYGSPEIVSLPKRVPRGGQRLVNAENADRLPVDN